MLAKINSARKAIASALGVLLTAVSLANTLHLPGHLGVIIGTAFAVLTPVVTWLTPNKAP